MLPDTIPTAAALARGARSYLLSLFRRGHSLCEAEASQSAVIPFRAPLQPVDLIPTIDSPFRSPDYRQQGGATLDQEGDARPVFA